MPTQIDPPSVNGLKIQEAVPAAPPPTVPDAAAAGRGEKAWREWMMIAVGLVGLLSVMATIIAVVALASKNPSRAVTVERVVSNPSAASASTTAIKPQALTIGIKADDQHGRRGPDGKWHDAFLPADFAVHAGSTVTVTFVNYDGGAHTFTSPAMGLSFTIPAGGGSLSQPRTVTLKFKAPSKPGKYAWFCAIPCDPWAMAHDGYMRGFVTVRA